MHFILTPVGSSGDVHPFVALGQGLQRRGHEVTLVCAEPFGEMTVAAGLACTTLGTAGDYEELVRHPDLWHPRRGPRVVVQACSMIMREAYDRLSELYRPGATVLVGHALSLATRVFEDKHHPPGATVHLAPHIFRSDHQQPIMIPGQDLSRLPRWTKRSIWWLADRLLVDPMITPSLNAWRRELALPPVRRLFKDWIHSPGALVGFFPDWFGLPQVDWPKRLHLAGFPFFDQSDDGPLDPDLQRFLDAGEAVVVVTPGSANCQAAAFFKAAVAACNRIRCRALLLTSFPEQLPQPLPEGTFAAGYVPFSRVLPRCAAVIHHGGIGSCAQGLAAGVPQLVMPMAFDQPDNGMRLRRLGLGDWLSPRAFTPRNVAERLRHLMANPATAAACRHYRDLVRGHDAIETACEVIERATLG